MPINKKKIRVMRAISLLTLCFFLVNQSAFAAPTAGIEMVASRETPGFLQIDIPADLATLDDIYEAPISPDPKLILQIQNAHANYGAQQKIKLLLAYLNKTYDINTIFVEGASERLDPDYLKYFPDSERNLKLAELFAKDGELTGAELYLIEAGSQKIKAEGIEDADLYRANYEALKKVFGAETVVNKYVGGIEARLATLSSKISSPDMRRLLSEWKKFEEGHRAFMPYIHSLADASKRILKLNLESLFSQVAWPQITRLLVIQEIEKEMNPARAEEEKDKLVKYLQEKHFSKDLIKAIEAFKDQHISVTRKGKGGAAEALQPRYLLERLVKEAGPKGFQFSDYPYFSAHAGYLILKSELDSIALFEEINRLFTEILDELAGTKNQKALLKLYRDEELVRKLLNLELTRSDWNETLQKKPELAMDSMVQRLKELGKAINSENNLAATAFETKTLNGKFQSRVKEVYDAAYSFYDYARQREEVFYEKMSAVMNGRDESKAVLITGGFHTDGVSELLREHEINYGILTPRLFQKSDENLYRKVMLQKQERPFSISYLEAVPQLIALSAQFAQGIVPADRIESALAKMMQMDSISLERAVGIFNASVAAQKNRISLSPAGKDGKGTPLYQVNQGEVTQEQIDDLLISAGPISELVSAPRIEVAPVVGKSEVRGLKPGLAATLLLGGMLALGVAQSFAGDLVVRITDFVALGPTKVATVNVYNSGTNALVANLTLQGTTNLASGAWQDVQPIMIGAELTPGQDVSAPVVTSTNIPTGFFRVKGTEAPRSEMRGYDVATLTDRFASIDLGDDAVAEALGSLKAGRAPDEVAQTLASIYDPVEGGALTITRQIILSQSRSEVRGLKPGLAATLLLGGMLALGVAQSFAGDLVVQFTDFLKVGPTNYFATVSVENAGTNWISGDLILQNTTNITSPSWQNLRTIMQSGLLAPSQQFSAPVLFGDNGPRDYFRVTGTETVTNAPGGGGGGAAAAPMTVVATEPEELSAPEAPAPKPSVKPAAKRSPRKFVRLRSEVRDVKELGKDDVVMGEFTGAEGDFVITETWDDSSKKVSWSFWQTGVGPGARFEFQRHNLIQDEKGSVYSWMPGTNLWITRNSKGELAYVTTTDGLPEDETPIFLSVLGLKDGTPTFAVKSFTAPETGTVSVSWVDASEGAVARVLEAWRLEQNLPVDLVNQRLFNAKRILEEGPETRQFLPTGLTEAAMLAESEMSERIQEKIDELIGQRFEDVVEPSAEAAAYLSRLVALMEQFQSIDRSVEEPRTELDPTEQWRSTEVEALNGDKVRLGYGVLRSKKDDRPGDRAIGLSFTGLGDSENRRINKWVQIEKEASASQIFYHDGILIVPEAKKIYIIESAQSVQEKALAFLLPVELSQHEALRHFVLESDTQRMGSRAEGATVYLVSADKKEAPLDMREVSAFFRQRLADQAAARSEVRGSEQELFNRILRVGGLFLAAGAIAAVLVTAMWKYTSARDQALDKKSALLDQNIAKTLGISVQEMPSWTPFFMNAYFLYLQDGNLPASEENFRKFSANTRLQESFMGQLNPDAMDDLVDARRRWYEEQRATAQLPEGRSEIRESTRDNLILLTPENLDILKNELPGKVQRHVENSTQRAAFSRVQEQIEDGVSLEESWEVDYFTNLSGDQQSWLANEILGEALNIVDSSERTLFMQSIQAWQPSAARAEVRTMDRRGILNAIDGLQLPEKISLQVPSDVLQVSYEMAPKRSRMLLVAPLVAIASTGNKLYVAHINTATQKLALVMISPEVLEVIKGVTKSTLVTDMLRISREQLPVDINGKWTEDGVFRSEVREFVTLAAEALKQGWISESSFENIRSWEGPEYAPTHAQLEAQFKKAGQDPAEWTKIDDAWYTNVAIGTAGMRGTRGLGTNRISAYTIGPLMMSHALAVNDPAYTRIIEGTYPEFEAEKRNRAVIIGGDSRYGSYDKETKTPGHQIKLEALINVALGIKAYVYRSPVTTPQLAWSVHELNVEPEDLIVSGSMNTASHNKKTDNGNKPYKIDGSQSTGIFSDLMKKHLSSANVAALSALTYRGLNILENTDEAFELALKNGDIHWVGGMDDDSYAGDDYHADEIFVQRELQEAIHVINGVFDSSKLNLEDAKIVISPLYGSSRHILKKILKARGLRDDQIIWVEDEPNSEFPGVEGGKPNPESPEARKVALKKAQDVDADLVLWNDPDGDRPAVAAKKTPAQRAASVDDYVSFNGNQQLAILMDYLIRELKALAHQASLADDQSRTHLARQAVSLVAKFDRVFVASTVVSGDLMKIIARNERLAVAETLVGFKYIGDQIELRSKAVQTSAGITETQWQALSNTEKIELGLQHSQTFLFGGEESLGALSSDGPHDKDALAGVAWFIEILGRLRATGTSSKGISFEDRLNLIYQTYGYFSERFPMLTKATDYYMGIQQANLSEAEAMEVIKAEDGPSILNRFRTQTPTSIAGKKVIAVLDFQAQTAKDPQGQLLFDVNSQAGFVTPQTPGIPESFRNALSVIPVPENDIVGATQKHLLQGVYSFRHEVLPNSDVPGDALPAENFIMLLFEDGSKVVARPSGTEPIIKFYINSRGLFNSRADVDTWVDDVSAELKSIADEVAYERFPAKFSAVSAVRDAIRQLFDAKVVERNLEDTYRLAVYYTSADHFPDGGETIAEIRRGLGVDFTVLRSNARVVKIKDPMKVLNDARGKAATVSVHTTETSSRPLSFEEAEVGILNGTITLSESQKLYEVPARSAPEKGTAKRSDLRDVEEISTALADIAGSVTLPTDIVVEAREFSDLLDQHPNDTATMRAARELIGDAAGLLRSVSEKETAKRAELREGDIAWSDVYWASILSPINMNVRMNDLQEVAQRSRLKVAVLDKAVGEIMRFYYAAVPEDERDGIVGNHNFQDTYKDLVVAISGFNKLERQNLQALQALGAELNSETPSFPTLRAAMTPGTVEKFSDLISLPLSRSVLSYPFIQAFIREHTPGTKLSLVRSEVRDTEEYSRISVEIKQVQVRLRRLQELEGLLIPKAFSIQPAITAPGPNPYSNREQAGRELEQVQSQIASAEKQLRELADQAALLVPDALVDEAIIVADPSRVNIAESKTPTLDIGALMTSWAEGLPGVVVSESSNMTVNEPLEIISLAEEIPFTILSRIGSLVMDSAGELQANVPKSVVYKTPVALHFFKNGEHPLAQTSLIVSYEDLQVIAPELVEQVQDSTDYFVIDARNPRFLVEIPKDSEVVLGRGSLEDDYRDVYPDTVSWQHLSIKREDTDEGTVLTITDLESTNGTSLSNVASLDVALARAEVRSTDELIAEVQTKIDGIQAQINFLDGTPPDTGLDSAAPLRQQREVLNEGLRAMKSKAREIKRAIELLKDETSQRTHRDMPLDEVLASKQEEIRAMQQPVRDMHKQLMARSELRHAKEIGLMAWKLRTADIRSKLNPVALQILKDNEFWDVVPVEASPVLDEAFQVAFLTHGILDLAETNEDRAIEQLQQLANALGAEAMAAVLKALPKGHLLPFTDVEGHVVQFVTNADVEAQFAAVKVLLALNTGQKYTFVTVGDYQVEAAQIRHDYRTWVKSVVKKGLPFPDLVDRFEVITEADFAKSPQKFMKGNAVVAVSDRARKAFKLVRFDHLDFQALVVNLEYDIAEVENNPAAHSGLVALSQKVATQPGTPSVSEIKANPALLTELPVFERRKDGTIAITNFTLTLVMDRIWDAFQALQQTDVSA